MDIVYHFRRLYSLDTLDTRFTTSSSTPAQHPALDIRARREPKEFLYAQLPGDLSRAVKKEAVIEFNAGSASASRWRTPEFFIYYVIFLVAVPLMFRVSYDISKPSHPNYPKYEGLLSPGWIPGRRVDNSDAQYAGFRDNIPYMLILVILHPLARRLYDMMTAAGANAPRQQGQSALTFPISKLSAADARMNKRVDFDLVFTCIFICALHGFSVVKILAIIYINFCVATRLSKQYVPFATWAFNIGLLFANELSSGYPYAKMAKMVMPSTPEVNSKTSHWGTWLDSYGGLIPRWEILFNLTVLRLISFNLDHYWSLDRASGSPAEKKQLDPISLFEHDRIDLPAKPDDYSFRNYFTYALYSPLYLTGPVLTFNDYISQLRYQPASITGTRTTLYGIRFLISLLTMEVMLHFIYAVAILKAKPAWNTYTPVQLSMLGYFNLHIIWLKLLLPWRFFRLWALLDGIDPPENMVRCMSDNYSALAFWRGWHRSFNRWIVRYIYIPLGGSGGPSTHGKWGKVRAVFNFLAVFTFVALWHDINYKLLMWGWLVTLFILPEVLARYLFPRNKWQACPDTYRVICGIGAVANIVMMMAANLVGFVVGFDGLMNIMHGIVGSYSGLVYLAVACAALFVGSQVMFETREQEIRHGIRMKC